jgi:hypothetical protein
MIYQFPSEFYFYTKVENHQRHKELLIPQFRADLDSTVQGQMAGTARTTFYNPNNKKYYDRQMVEDIIWNPFHQLLKEYNLQRTFHITDSKIQDIWWNHYEPGQYAAPHRHLRCDFTGIYCLQMNEPNTTCLLPSLEQMNTIPLYDGIKTTHEVQEGDVLIFPATMLHWATPAQFERFVVVFNITLDIQKNPSAHTV